MSENVFKLDQGGTGVTTLAALKSLLGIGVVSESIGVGTAYILTNTSAAISFGTSGDLSVSLPSDGTYEIAANLPLYNPGVASNGEFSVTAILNNGSPMSNTERLIANFVETQVGNGETAQIGGCASPTWLITVGSSSTIKVFIATSASKSDVTIASNSVGLATLSYKKIS